MRKRAKAAAIVLAALVLAAAAGCGKDKGEANDGQTVEGEAEPWACPVGVKLTPDAAGASGEQAGEALFPGGPYYYDGTVRLDPVEGGDQSAVFRQAAGLPYGFYIPETMDVRKIGERVEWGMRDRHAWLSLSVEGETAVSLSRDNAELAAFAEYAGSLTSDTGTVCDYIRVADHGRQLVILLQYGKADRDAALPQLTRAAWSLRHIADPAAFKPGMEIAFPAGGTADETEIYELVRRSHEALAAKDKASFRSTLESPDADYLDYLIENEGQRRYTRLIGPADVSRDARRAQVRVEYELMWEGRVLKSRHDVALLKGRGGRWYVADID